MDYRPKVIKYNISCGGVTWLLKVGKCLLSDRLKCADITQQELAEILHVQKSRISEYVNNKHVMNYETARNVSSILGCSMEDLYEWHTVADE